MAKQQILLVDADPSSTRVLEVSLRSAGFNVTTASSAESALGKLEHSIPDLVLSDTHLPGADGFEFIRTMRQMPEMRSVPVVFVTEQGALDDKLRGLELGVDDYLAKPIFVREVVTRVHMLLARRNQQKIATENLARTRFSGHLEDVAVVDLLQTIGVSQKSGVATVKQGRRQAQLYFRNGQLVDAVAGELRGEEAVYRTITWTTGSFDLEFGPVDREPSIEAPTHALLMEGLRRVDELGRLSEQLPPADALIDLDHDALLERLTEIPDELNGILRLINGKITVADLVDASPFDDLSTLTVLSKFYFEGLLVVTGSSQEPPGVEILRSHPPIASLAPMEHISSTAQLGADAVPDPLDSEHGPVLRGRTMVSGLPGAASPSISGSHGAAYPSEGPRGAGSTPPNVVVSVVPDAEFVAGVGTIPKTIKSCTPAAVVGPEQPADGDEQRSSEEGKPQPVHTDVAGPQSAGVGPWRAPTTAPPAPAAFVDEVAQQWQAERRQGTQMGGLRVAQPQEEETSAQEREPLVETRPLVSVGTAVRVEEPLPESEAAVRRKRTQFGLGNLALSAEPMADPLARSASDNTQPYTSMSAPANPAVATGQPAVTHQPEEDSFFDEGEQGTYEGGPHSVPPAKPLSVEIVPHRAAPRVSSPEQLARARKGRRLVLGLVAAAAGLLLVGLWVNDRSTAEQPMVSGSPDSVNTPFVAVDPTPEPPAAGHVTAAGQPESVGSSVEAHSPSQDKGAPAAQPGQASVVASEPPAARKLLQGAASQVTEQAGEQPAHERKVTAEASRARRPSSKPSAEPSSRRRRTRGQSAAPKASAAPVGSPPPPRSSTSPERSAAPPTASFPLP